MIVFEPVLPEDLLSFELINLDSKSESYSFSYYMKYFSTFPSDFYSVRNFFHNVVKSSMVYTKPMLGYIMGRIEQKDMPCLHLSAISIAPSARKFKIGSQLMKLFEQNGNAYKTWFIDFYVRKSNLIALSFYKSLGYVIYRTVFDYYVGPKDDAYDMRKSLEIDNEKKCEIKGVDIHCNELSY